LSGGRWTARGAIISGLLALLVATAWSPAIRDPGSGLRISDYQASLLSGDTAPDTIGPVVNVEDDATGRILFSKQAFKHHAIGSITKLMTAILAIHHLKLNQVVAVSNKAASVGGSSMFLKAGDHVSVRALLYGLLIPSGNDAAETLAEAMAGNDKGFARLANRQAKAYHLLCSHYVTPHGLDAPHQYSCAADVATMMRRVIRVPFLVKVMGTSQTVVHGVGPNQVFPLYSTDDLLGVYPGIIAGKTGTTEQAGASLTVADRQHGHTVVCVVLGSTYTGRFSDCASLLTFAHRAMDWVPAPDLAWSTSALLHHSSVAPAPVPAWESSWITINANGMPTAPFDSHR
jgi:D-alanyl-D-alanine carboxypeptidase (penicillin-binding protein 5/6)